MTPAAASSVAARLKGGAALPDLEFDRFVPELARRAGLEHWSPLYVARTVAQWLNELQVLRVVDIGSGTGKFCVAAALAAPRCEFIGLEHRAWLVDIATDLARLFEVSGRARFVLGSLGSTPLPVSPAYYLFNPFGEHLLDRHERIANDMEFSREHHRRDVAGVERLLSAQPPGCRVILYNGFGACPPAGYAIERQDAALPNLLQMWRKGEG